MAARRGARSRSGGLFSQEEEKGGADRVPLMHLVVVCGVVYAVVMNCVECVHTTLEILLEAVDCATLD